MALTKVTSGVRTLGTGEVATANMAVDPTNASNLASGTVPSARLPSTGTSWQAVQTTGFTAVAGNGYPCNTTGGTFTCTLPATAIVGDTIELVDYAGTFDTNQLTLDPQSLNMKGATTDLRLNQEREGVRLVYADATQGWVAVTGVNEIAPVLSPLAYDVEYLVVAGGGGGGMGLTTPLGGGGGAGGYRANTNLNLIVGTQYTVTVGAGGAGGTPADSGNDGTSGSDSVFATITSTGGGAGGGNDRVGLAGGSGGGGGAHPSNTDAGGSGTAGQGYAGGTAPAVIGSGAGGGASEAGGVGTGGDPPTTGDMKGGDGIANDIVETGTDVTYAGGGGGGTSAGSYNANACDGGAGGGGDGGQRNNDGGQSGTDGLGGGGGGCYVVINAGGDGIVVVRILTANYSGTTTGSPTITTDGSYTVLKYLASGSYTA